MPLTKEQKREAVADISTQLEDVNTVYLTDFEGLSVADANELRSAFREADVEYKVLKNTLLRRALEEKGGFDELFDKLHGPTAVAFTNDPAGPAKVIKAFLEEKGGEVPRLKGAYVDGAIYDGGALDALAKLKSKDELVAEIAALLMAPMKNIAAALDSQGSQLAAAIQAIADGGEAEA